MTKNWYKRKEPIKSLPKIDLEWSPGFIIKDELSEIPVTMRKEEHDRLHRHIEILNKFDRCMDNFYKTQGIHKPIFEISNPDCDKEWIKANPQMHNFITLKKWEEFKDMKKKEIRNVGFENTVMVPVDVKTNLASIDADELRRLYMSRDNADSNYRYYRDLSNRLDAKNTNLKDVNTQVVEENEKLKEENDRLKTKVTRLQIMANSFYGASCYPCTCINCPSNIAYSANAFAKAAKSLAEHVKSGKPTYDQLVEEVEKLRKENHRLLKDQESLEAEVDELDKECDALVEEKEALQAEMQDKIDSFKINLDYHVKQENYFREQYHKYKDKIKELEEELEKYKKQCNRLSNEKMNISSDESLAKSIIENLQTRLDILERRYKEVNEEYAEYIKSTEDDQSYFKLWKDLADKYCKLEDRYKVAVDLGDKLLKQVTDLEKEKELALDSCEPSGTGCCLDEE